MGLPENNPSEYDLAVEYYRDLFRRYFPKNAETVDSFDTVVRNHEASSRSTDPAVAGLQRCVNIDFGHHFRGDNEVEDLAGLVAKAESEVAG